MSHVVTSRRHDARSAFLDTPMDNMMRDTFGPPDDARTAYLYTPMDDLMRDAFGPPDDEVPAEMHDDEWAMPSLVPTDMHDDEWVSLRSTDDDEWIMVPSPRRSRSAAAATTERADLASSMLQLENIQHRLDALQLEIYWYGVAPLGAKTTSEELLEQFSAGGEDYDRHEAARFHRWVENARRAHIRRERSVAQPRVY